jgi:hypothetical protein
MRRSHFSSGMHQAAIANRGEQKGQRKIEAQNLRAQTAFRKRDRMPRPKSNVVENPAVFPERNLALGSAIEIVKNGFRQSLARDRAEIFDAYHPGRGYSTVGFAHLQNSGVRKLEAGDILPPAESAAKRKFSDYYFSTHKSEHP